MSRKNVVFHDFPCFAFRTQFPWCFRVFHIEGDQFKVNMGEKKSVTNIDIEMYLTLLGNI